MSRAEVSILIHKIIFFLQWEKLFSLAYHRPSSMINSDNNFYYITMKNKQISGKIYLYTSKDIGNMWLSQ